MENYWGAIEMPFFFLCVFSAEDIRVSASDKEVIYDRSGENSICFGLCIRGFITALLAWKLGLTASIFG